ncbi:MAG: ATP-binding protein, partial [Candidatus Heimdallarchaeaceae archaeon]
NKGDFTYDKIAENIERKEGSVRLAIHRNKDYFLVTKPKGKICNITLKQMAVDEIQARIDRKKGEEEQIRQREILKELDKKKQEYIENEIMRFLKQTKLKREGKIIFIDYNELVINNPKITEYLLDNPTSLLEAINSHFNKRYDIKFSNLPESINVSIESLRKEHLEKLCPSCGSLIIMKQNYREGNVKEPTKCFCGRKGGFRIKETKEQNCSFLQLEDLQEKTDNPHSKRVKAVIFNGLCESDRIKIFSPGNEIKCYGILKKVPTYKRNKKTLFSDWILEIIDAEPIEKDIDISKFTEEEVKEIKDLSKEVNDKGLNPVLESFAPDVYGYEYIKGALALQLCNRRNDTKNKKMRNKSNILLIGDPGVAKSVMCNFAVSITHGAKRAVGGGSSAVGMTASVVREEESIGGYRVEPGSMILAKDLLFIDEMNNMNEDDKPKLQEGMSEQTISINKANIHCEMKVTCGIIAASNPKDGHFDPNKYKVEEDFNIPSPILNRFDTIFVLKDKIDEETDRNIASKMIKRHRGSLENNYDKAFLKRFFAYVRQQEEPIINDEAEELLQKTFIAARKYNDDGVKLNARFLESINRMAIASAKIRLSKKVERKDIERALDIIKHSQYRINNDMILKDLK